MPCPFRTVLTVLAVVAAGCLVFLEFFWDKETLNRRVITKKDSENTTETDTSTTTDEKSQIEEFPASKCPYMNLKYYIIRSSRKLKALSPSYVFGLSTCPVSNEPTFSDRPLGFKVAYISAISVLIIAHMELFTGGYFSKMIRNFIINRSDRNILDLLKETQSAIYLTFQPLFDTLAQPFSS